MNKQLPRPRGLAALSPERRREIARAGGKASTGGFRAMAPERLRAVGASGGRRAHIGGLTHEWTTEEAALAGRKGGLAPRRRRTMQEAS